MKLFVAELSSEAVVNASFWPEYVADLGSATLPVSKIAQLIAVRTPKALRVCII